LKRTPITFLQKHYKESEGHYKDIKRKAKTAGGMKEIKDSSDFASPSPFFFTKEFVVQ
jgi:hypothetical protein